MQTTLQLKLQRVYKETLSLRVSKILFDSLLGEWMGPVKVNNYYSCKWRFTFVFYNCSICFQQGFAKESILISLVKFQKDLTILNEIKHDLNNLRFLSLHLLSTKYRYVK